MNPQRPSSRLSAVLFLSLISVIATGCSARLIGDTSPELGRITEPNGDIVRYTVRAGGRIEKALLVSEPDAYLGAVLRKAPRGRLGARVDDLMHGGPAEAAGIEISDVILTFGGAKIRSTDNLRARVIETPVGSRVPVSYRRRDEVRKTEIDFFERREAVAERQDLPDLEHHGDNLKSGIEVVTVPAELSARLLGSADRRVVVTAVGVGSPGYTAGIRPGDHLLEANGEPLATAADFRALIEKHEAGDPIALTVEQGGQRLQADVRLADLTHTTYWDLPVIFHHVSNADATSTHVGSIIYSREDRPLATSRREGARHLDVSLLLGLVKWEERRTRSGLRLFWVLPIGW